MYDDEPSTVISNNAPVPLRSAHHVRRMMREEEAATSVFNFQKTKFALIDSQFNITL